MATHPELVELLAALEARDHPQVASTIAAITASGPLLGERWAQLARAASSIGELDLANAALAIRARQSPGSKTALFDQVVMLARTNRPQEARAALATLPESVPDPGAHWYLRGTLELNLGNFAAAGEALERSLSHSPASGQALLALAATSPEGRAPGLIDRLRTLAAAMMHQSALERACYHYALCKAYKDQGDHRAAFGQAAMAGAICKSDRPYRPAQDRSHALAIVESFSASSIAGLRSRCADSDIAPIFVIGLPRTGTTLLQQILASHSAVADGAELGRMPVMTKRMGTADPNGIADYASRNPALSPARLYAHLAKQFDRSNGIILDKSIDNTRHVGLIKAIMPNSKLISIRRDPLASAWSVFSTYFTRSLNWSFDLEDIGRHFAIEQRLHDHWQTIFAEDMLSVAYEDLVHDSVAVTRQILHHCNLREEDGPFHHHRSANAIATASVVQAREPIYQSAVSGAEPYRQLMQSFFDTFERELRATHR